MDQLISTNQFDCEQVTFHFAFQPKLFHNVFNLHAPPNFCHAPLVGRRTTDLGSCLIWLRLGFL